MLPLPYTPTRANGLLAKFLKMRKAKLPPQLRTRVVRGRTETYQVQPKALSDGAQATARVLLFWALDAVEQVRQVSALQAADPSQPPLPPPVATNAESLAKFRQVSARAIRDHLTELLRVGIIARKVFRGTRSNFEVYLNPEFLWKVPQPAAQSPKKSKFEAGQSTDSTNASATNFPLISLEKQDKKEIEIGLVEKLLPHEAPGDLTGNTGPQVPPKIAPTAPKSPSQGPQEPKSGAAAVAEKAGDNGPESGDKPVYNPELQARHQLEQQRLELVRATWFYAWKRLYPSRQFDSAEQERALEAIWCGTYRGFTGPEDPRQWARYHDQVMERIDLAAAYFARHEDKFAPCPYAEFVAGTGYFDAENRYGFEGTAAWLRKHHASRRQRSLSDALLKARRQMKAHRLGIAPARVQAMTTLQLFRHHEAKLRAFGEQALKRFYAQVAPSQLPVSEN